MIFIISGLSVLIHLLHPFRYTGMNQTSSIKLYALYAVHCKDDTLQYQFSSLEFGVCGQV